MAKRVFLIHGWEGNPENNWFPWLKAELEKRKIQVITPSMPNPLDPRIEDWVRYLRGQVGEVGKEDYFIGHSIGCQAIMRYVQELSENTEIGGIICVAGFFTLPYLETEEEKQVAGPWLTTPINTEKIKQTTDKIVAIFSDNDPDVPISDADLFKERLDAKIIAEHNKGHFSDDAGVKELPSVLEELLNMMGVKEEVKE